MSHVTSIEIKIRDLDALAGAAEDIGMVLDRDARTFAAFYEGTKGDRDNTCDAGALRMSEEALRASGKKLAGDNFSRAFEVGVRRAADGDGYELRYDPWNDGNGLHKVAGENLNRLRQGYAARVAEKALRRAGHKVHKTLTTDGRVILRAEVKR